MKLKLKIPREKSEPITISQSKAADKKVPDSLGTMEQLADKLYLEQLHKEALATKAEARYYDMLETQISSLANKVVKMGIKRQEIPDANKHIDKLRIAINEAENILDALEQLERELLENRK